MAGSLCAMWVILWTGCVSTEHISSADGFSDYNGSKLVLCSLALFCISFARMNSWFESENRRLKGLVQSNFIYFSELPFHIEMSGTKDGSAALAPWLKAFVRGICRAVVSLGSYDFHYAENADGIAESSHKKEMNKSKVGLCMYLNWDIH